MKKKIKKVVENEKEDKSKVVEGIKEYLKTFEKYISEAKVVVSFLGERCFKALNDIKKIFKNYKEKLAKLEKDLEKLDEKDVKKLIGKLLSFAKTIVEYVAIIKKIYPVYAKYCDAVESTYTKLEAAADLYLKKKIKENLVAFVKTGKDFAGALESLFIVFMKLIKEREEKEKK